MFTHVFALSVMLLDGILAGMFLCSTMIEHGMRRLAAPEWIAYKQAKELVFAAVMPPVFLVCLIATIVAAVVVEAWLPFAVAALLLAAVHAITMTVHLPLNRLFMSWSSTGYPVTWDAGRRRWRQWNLARTWLVIIASVVILTAQA